MWESSKTKARKSRVAKTKGSRKKGKTEERKRIGVRSVVEK